MTDLTQILADHVAGFAVSGVPATAAARLGLDLADTLAAAVGGMRAAGVPETLDTLAAEAGLGVSRVIGDARRLPATFAAQANAKSRSSVDRNAFRPQGTREAHSSLKLKPISNVVSSVPH